ncbi:GNAT family N-acetyltransferase [Ancylobacter amanitiformis]|uniref:N-acyltransferase n=1 Tax=Ancylobacter amanitiformis TaxID=217069 RepID=A0ABU0LPM5_9HYPH|nr:GNAT family N-acetyltransferase [Ancylobacter amanitiformis]MDQ0510656.1 putative N-acyltransferase [Ancylobacter amanitiformis]
MPDETITLRVESDITKLSAADWNACANPASNEEQTTPGTSLSLNGDSASDTPPRQTEPPATGGEEPAYNPFVSHEYLSALEESGSASRATGWLPQHLVLADAEGVPLGICPAYLKSHSRGEYVFDEGWADAFERAGGRYYPKLQVSVPFTPATGPRLLVRAGAPAMGVRQALGRGLLTLAQMRGASSVHATFLGEGDAQALEAEGFLPRTDQQFHWHNRGYGDYEAFLGDLASRKRKAIRRERREALGDGITLHWLTGNDITEEAWDAFFAFYMETGSRKWGRPYLNRQFYSLIGARMAERILLVMAKRAGRWIAGAINFIGSDALYGRHWGAIEQHPFLHFEVCYHQAIEFAIARGLKTVEAGAQGEHKLARGYLPVTTRSAHYIVDPDFRAAVAHYLERERRYVADAGAELSELGPFRRDLDPAELDEP